MTKKILLAIVVLCVAAQVIRPGRTNPPEYAGATLYGKMRVPKNVADILERSCRDCHSNRTTWPWYAQIAPISWLLAHDVKEGRRELNISEWNRYDSRRAARKLNEVCEQVERGDMPIGPYLAMHPDAKLSAQDKSTICIWAKAAEATLKAAQ